MNSHKDVGFKHPLIQLVLGLLMLPTSMVTFAQRVDPFDAAADGYAIVAALEQADGKLLLAGDFSHLAGQPRAGIGRFNPDGSLDETFAPSQNISPTCLAIQMDRRILVGGANGLGRLNSDGSWDATFDAKLQWDRYAGSVYALALQSNGKILVGGRFTTAGGQSHTNIARLNADGSVDAGFEASAAGPYSKVNCVVLQPDDKVLVGGIFSELSGHSRTNLGRLNPDGSFDPSSSGFASLPTTEVSVLALQPDGGILAGGLFEPDGERNRGLVRLLSTGELDGTFNPHIQGSIDTLLLQADGNILVGGSICSFDGWLPPTFYCSGFGRISPDGVRDDSSVFFGDAPVTSLSLQADGAILAAGLFSSLDYVPRHAFARVKNSAWTSHGLFKDDSGLLWSRSGAAADVISAYFYSSPDGLTWTKLGDGVRTGSGWRLPGVAIPTNGYIRACAIIAGGYHNGSSMVVEDELGVPQIKGQPPSLMQPLGSTAVFSVHVGGTPPFAYFWLKDGEPVRGAVVSYDLNGSTLTLTNISHDLAGQYSVLVSNMLGCILSQPATLTIEDPFIFAQATNQTSYTGRSALFAVGVNGTVPLTCQWLKDGVELPGAVDPELVLTNLQRADQGGYQVVISNIYGVVTSAVASLTLYLDVDAFCPAADTSIRALVPQADGNILVAGQFTTLGGEACTNLGRLTPAGALDKSFQAQLTGTLDCLAVQPDGKILIGGRLLTVGGEPHRGVVRFNPDGTLDTAFAPIFNEPFAEVLSLAMQPDGRIVVGGAFTNLCGQTRNGMGRLFSDGTLDPSFDPGFGTPMTNAIVSSLALQCDGKVLVGGRSLRFAGTPRFALARLNPDGTLDESFTTDADGPLAVLAVQSDGQVLIGGWFTHIGTESHAGLARLSRDGLVDAAFQPEVTGTIMSLVIQADGKILVSGAIPSLGGRPCGNLGRLNPNGSLDTAFHVDGDGTVATLSIQADGKILAGGSFTVMGGQPRRAIARLINTDTPSELLSFRGALVTWVRQGAGPDVTSATFQLSTNQVDWLTLDPGQPIPGGWQANASGHSPKASIRALGVVMGGYENCSSWVVETVAHPPTVSPPVIALDSAFGFRSNRFGFHLLGVDNQSVVVESSTDLAHWSPIWTNSQDGNPPFFVDPQTDSIPCRFYRAR